MAGGVCTISGAYNIYTDLAVMPLFIQTCGAGFTSGASVFVLPAGGGNVYLGVWRY